MVARSAVVATWKRAIALSWPVSVEHLTRTGMRTTDVLVTGAFSPAAITAVGLADLYARFPLRIGLGLGAGAIALSSQDTGAAAARNRDEAVTQALLLGVLAGIPFVVAGALFGSPLIAILGAPADVARMGGTYLAIVFATAPARHANLVAARALQGTGDTRTPMSVNILANASNVVGSVVLGWGLFGAPRLGIVGVGVATAGANLLSAGLFVVALASSGTAAGLARPTDRTVARQLVTVSAPKVGEGLVSTLVQFPFNALLLGFGTTVNAGYQVGRRAYQQVTAPLARGLNVAGNVFVGQALGEGDPDRATFDGWAVVGLGVLSAGAIGLGLVAGAPAFVSLFTDDPETTRFGVGFARVFGLSAPALVTFTVLSGALQGASETRVPFVARVSANLLFLLGASYVLGIPLGFGVVGAYAGVGLNYLWMALGAVVGFHHVDWAGRATGMMAERGTIADPEAEDD